MNRKTLFAALACALLVFSMLGCGTTNSLKTITLSASLINGVAPKSQGGFFNLVGNGGTIQMAATGTYTSGKTADLTNRVVYSVVVDPVNNIDAFDEALLPPCAGSPCPSPDQGPFTNGTVQYDSTGLITAVDPATCTWVDVSSDPKNPSWAYVGAYRVTATFQGVTSQPVYIPVASSIGPVTLANPSGACGPTVSQ